MTPVSGEEQPEWRGRGGEVRGGEGRGGEGRGASFAAVASHSLLQRASLKVGQMQPHSPPTLWVVLT